MDLDVSDIRLIASDMDGTLLPYYGAVLDPSIFALIEELEKRGIRFMAASGRQHGSIVKQFEPVKDRIDFLCENGCLLFSEGKLMSKSVVSRETAHGIISAFLEHPDYDLMISGEETCYIEMNKREHMEFLENTLNFSTTEVPSLYDIPEDYFKLSAHNRDEEKAKRDMSYWQSLFPGKATAVYGGGGWVDFTAYGVSKGSAIRGYMKEKGINPSQVMAFGDNYNDWEMLKSVGFPVAMASATEEIRLTCAMTTDNVIETIKKLFDISL